MSVLICPTSSVDPSESLPGIELRRLHERARDGVPLNLLVARGQVVPDSAAGRTVEVDNLDPRICSGPKALEQDELLLPQVKAAFAAVRPTQVEIYDTTILGPVVAEAAVAAGIRVAVAIPSQSLVALRDHLLRHFKAGKAFDKRGAFLERQLYVLTRADAIITSDELIRQQLGAASPRTEVRLEGGQESLYWLRPFTLELPRTRAALCVSYDKGTGEARKLIRSAEANGWEVASWFRRGATQLADESKPLGSLESLPETCDRELLSKVQVAFLCGGHQPEPEIQRELKELVVKLGLVGVLPVFVNGIGGEVYSGAIADAMARLEAELGYNAEVILTYSPAALATLAESFRRRTCQMIGTNKLTQPPSAKLGTPRSAHDV